MERPGRNTVAKVATRLEVPVNTYKLQEELRVLLMSLETLKQKAETPEAHAVLKTVMEQAVRTKEALEELPDARERRERRFRMCKTFWAFLKTGASTLYEEDFDDFLDFARKLEEM
jgi:hypothetical protein